MLLSALLLTTVLTAPAASDCAGLEPQPWADLCVISSDEMKGREVESEGNARARAYIIARLTEIGVETVGEGYEHPFSYEQAIDFRDPNSPRETINAVNVIGVIPGADRSRAIAVTAHYDHVGQNEAGEIYNGADDNASGVAALLATAEHFVANPPQNDILIMAFDAEESGLRGAREVVANPVDGTAPVAFNLNFDMLGYSPDNDIWAAGPYHTPALTPIVEEIAAEASITLAAGYDSPDEDPRNDWTLLSDQGAFHMGGIPFLYLGVEDHEHYHQTTDEFETIDPDFFLGAVSVAMELAERIDADLDMVLGARAAD